MATKKGVWNLQQVRDKQLQSLWDYEGTLSGSLYLWGTGYYGAIGNNKADGHNPAPSVYIKSPTQVPGTWANAMFACNGDNNNGGIKTDGTLWIWGDNSYGQLGQNQSNPHRRSSPVQVGSDTTWSTKNYHVSGDNYDKQSYAIKTDGTLWGWGLNSFGSLGLNQSHHPAGTCSSPTQIPGTTWHRIGDYGQGAHAIKRVQTSYQTVTRPLA